jgi:hypothetical protein
MRNLHLHALTLIFALVFCASAYAADRVICYAMWDDDFLYAAFEVKDPDVVGSNITHMSSPWEDDAVELYLETDAKRSPTRSSGTFQMSASAAGGSSFLVGEGGKAVAKKIFTFKYARKVTGTLNRSDDVDKGYVIELAMPWSEMGGPPEPGRIMGFNIVCRMKGEQQGFVSLSTQVASEEDIQSPAKWGSIKFVIAPTIIVMQDGAIVCRRVVNRPPLIDGNLGPGEWIRDMAFHMVKPEPPAVKEIQHFSIEKLAMATYCLWNQGDADDSSRFALHPMEGTTSSGSSEYHKEQLIQARNAGIDVLLPAYHGKSDLPALGRMIQAMRELRAEEKSYPLIGMLLDAGSLHSGSGDDIASAVYDFVREFFLCVPQDLTSTIQTPAEKGWSAADILVISGSVPGDVGKIREYCDRRFAQDFGGRKLIWIGDSQSKSAAVDGCARLGAGCDAYVDKGGWLRVGTIGLPAKTTSEEKIDTYKREWNALISESPDWVVLDSWNDLVRGTAICATAEHGSQYADLTKINLLRFNGMRPYDAKYIKHDVPSTMLPGGIYQVMITAENAGIKPWYTGSQGVFLAARWYKDGSLYADSGMRLPLQQTVLAGQMLDKTLGIQAIDQENQPLAEGDYELRIEFTRGHDEWFSAAGDTPLCIPVRIGTPAPGFALVRSTLPAALKYGAKYDVKLALRNAGPVAWKAGDVRIAYRWYDISAEAQGGNDRALLLQSDVEPGRIAEFTVPVESPAAMAAFRVLRWDVFDKERSLAESGIGCASQMIAL